MASRRRDGLTFDIGAQYFTVREPAFAAQVAALESAGVVARWQGRMVHLCWGSSSPAHDAPARYVGVPRMSAITRYLSAGLELRCGVRVQSVCKEDTGWRLRDSDGIDLGRYDRVVVTAPAPQAAALLQDVPELARQAEEALLDPCWAVMLEFAAPLDIPWDAAWIEGSPLTWCARESARPGRPPTEAWVLHATAEWSRMNLERTPADVAQRLLVAFGAVTGISAAPTSAQAHRWRHAQVIGPFDEPYRYDSGVGVCGDWLAGARVEAAWMSGDGLGALLASLG